MADLQPVTPGELLREELLVPKGISQYRLTREIGVPRPRISEIVTGKRSISADTDLRLCRFFGLSDGFWPRAQAAHDTEVARESLADVLDRINPWSAECQASGRGAWGGAGTDHPQDAIPRAAKGSFTPRGSSWASGASGPLLGFVHSIPLLARPFGQNPAESYAATRRRNCAPIGAGLGLEPLGVDEGAQALGLVRQRGEARVPIFGAAAE